jgi:methylphosphotriester-DNA--protein-cysteine methyltransferase
MDAYGDPALRDTADQQSLEWLEHLIEEAGGDDRTLLRLIRDNYRVTLTHAERLRQARNEAARRLRDEHVPMTEIAAEAGVTDSFMSRQLIAGGASRRADRTRTPPQASGRPFQVYRGGRLA